MLNKIKEKLSEPLRQSARLFHRIGFTPTTTSLLGLLSAVVSGIAYYSVGHNPDMIYVALGFLVLSGFLDAVDGAMARLYGQVTRFGGVLDSVIDRIEEAAVLVGMIAGGLTIVSIGLIALVGSFMVSYLRARVENEGVEMSGVGFAERPERLIILIIASLVQHVDIGVMIIAVVTWITVVQRVIHAYARLRGKK